MGANCGGRGKRIVDFVFFCNIKPFYAKIMLPEYIFAIIEVNAKILYI